MLSNIFFNIYIPFLFFLPCFCIIFLSFISSSNLNILRQFALLGSLFIFFIVSISFNFFKFYRGNFLFINHFFSDSRLNFDLVFGLDGISFVLIFLTSLLIPICILCSWNSLRVRFKEFLILLFLTELILFLTFTTLDVFWFYIFFEASLMPMFCIIGVWGSRTRRVRAAYQFFLYTFAGSIFFLLAVVYIAIYFGSTNYFYLLHFSISPKIQLFLWLAFFISFAVKIPMYPVHTWLPEAHVEAPTAGSVLLAGILLKLGTYGLLRYSLCLFPYASQFFGPFIFTMSLLAIIYSSCTTLRQIDLKKIIAYTSVAHMNLVTLGIFSQNVYGVEGSLFLMFSHGLVSSGLFLCVGCIYDRYGTRLLRYYGGLVNLMPFFSFIFLVFSLANMGLPGTSAFIGEFLILLGIFVHNSLIAFIASISVILSAAYALWLANRLLFGKISQNINNYSDLNSREFFFLIILVFFVFIFGIFPNTIFNLFHYEVSDILLSFENYSN